MQNSTIKILAVLPCAAFLFSCASVDWVDTKVRNEFNEYDMQYSGKIENDGKSWRNTVGEISSKKEKYAALYQDILIRLREGAKQSGDVADEAVRQRNSYSKEMERIGEKIRNSANITDKESFRKSLEDAKAIADAQIGDWSGYCGRTNKWLTLSYGDFFEKGTLYELAATPIKRRICNPLPEKQWKLLNADIAKYDELIEKFKNVDDNPELAQAKVQNIFLFSAIKNYRVSAMTCMRRLNMPEEKYNGLKWDADYLIIEKLGNLTASDRESDVELSAALDTMHINQAYACDILIRMQNCTSQEEPLVLAYFIQRMGMTCNYLPEPWRKAVSGLVEIYIVDFNNRAPMTQ